MAPHLFENAVKGQLRFQSDTVKCVRKTRVVSKQLVFFEFKTAQEIAGSGN